MFLSLFMVIYLFWIQSYATQLHYTTWLLYFACDTQY